MRVVVLLPKMNVGAELALNRLLDEDDHQVVGIIRSDNSVFTKRYWKYLGYALRRWGLFYSFLVGSFFVLHLFGLLLVGLMWWRRKKNWVSVDRLIARHGLKVYDTENINALESIQILQSWKPDVVVSLYFDQILKKEALSVAKLANLNMHPGPLPKYKGLWPCFWQLYNRAKKAGVTVHTMTEQIDAGDILAVRSYPIEYSETKHSLLVKSGHYGGLLVKEVLKKIAEGRPIKPITAKGKAIYYSLPSRKQIKRFFSRKKRFFWLPTEIRQWFKMEGV